MPHYRDYAGPNFPNLSGLANYRVRVQAPVVGTVSCPAVEYTFTVSEDQGKTWHHPSETTIEELKQAVCAQPDCCRNLGDECPTKS